MPYRSAIIDTYTGKQFDIMNPEPAMYDIHDVAHGLSMCCRFTGQSRVFYSVSQHSRLVMTYVLNELGEKCSKRMLLLALLHDGAEAYCGDVSKPFKNMLPDYASIERVVQRVLWEAFNIAPPNHEELLIIKRADAAAFQVEHDDLIREKDPLRIKSIEPNEEKFLFLELYKGLRTEGDVKLTYR